MSNYVNLGYTIDKLAHFFTNAESGKPCQEYRQSFPLNLECKATVLVFFITIINNRLVSQSNLF